MPGKYYPPTIGRVKYIHKNRQYAIERGQSWQGTIYKNYKNYEKYKDRHCYVPELNDEIYTKNDFLRIARGNKTLANFLFETVDWQSPETLMQELIN